MLLDKYPRVTYKDLPAKLQETYNFQKASAILADYGFITNLLKYDWLGADFLAQHMNGDWLKIQLKGRLTASPDYEGKDLYIMFEDKEEGAWYLYPHDELTAFYREKFSDKAFSHNGHSRGKPSKPQKEWLAQYRISA
jgi:hypothetical protein